MGFRGSGLLVVIVVAALQVPDVPDLPAQVSQPRGLLEVFLRIRNFFQI
jgi:hypothetical protein